MKIVINTNKETTDNIIAATNSQNPVSPTLLRATEPIHRNIELFFQNKGYYYDRRKNYYKNQGKPSAKIFGIKFTAQSIESIIYGSPHTARSSPTALLKKETNYNRIFNEDNDFKAYLNCCLINKNTHNSWLKIENPELKSKIANFKLHLAKLMPNFHLGKEDILLTDIIDINPDEIIDDTFNAALAFLSEVIDEYLEQNEGYNLINIAKSSGFTSYINSRITEKYSS